MTDQKTEQQFVDAIKNRFDQSVDNMDAVTLSRFNSIRHEALEPVDKKPRHRILLPAGAMVAVSITFILFAMLRPDPSSPFMAEDIEMFSSSEGIEFYENLEFYQWLEEYDISV